ncbi:hypothetical protein KOW79_009011 [Hemibagrus wyckioides]|uniref:Uncharacterized protein n=1 Tax=Hemibagrus wyckioides TaxID=337641 RepID=A0A9D3NUL4_9TELE|nr:protein bunched, class 1/class 3/D/E isoforms-like [Hemibagrus wyckioides]KAG7327405.1 hypothetical protein KOW79_009011 [Hemibagrus wyckioides]
MNSSPAHSPTDCGSVPNYRRSRSCSTSIDIDSRIAQAMDLVKTHMLSAVREEVEPLREKIRNLTERNIELERENHLLRSLTIYQIALSSGLISNHNTALSSGQISNHNTALSSGQISNHNTALTSTQIKKYPTALTSGQITNHHTALSSGQISNHNTALSSGQISNHNTALTSTQIKKYPTALTSGQITNHNTEMSSGQITNHNTALTSNHHSSRHDISIPERSENVIFRSADYSNNGCFSVNTQPYLNVAIKRDVRCV